MGIRVSKGFTIERIEETFSLKIFGKDLSELIVFTLILMYTIVFSHFTILKYYAFRTGAWDMGIFTQSLWTTLYHGKFFYHTCELFLNPSGSLFAVHISPILFLILPLYAICPSPETLLILQSFILASGSLPLYWLARDNLNSKSAGVAFALALLLYPPLHGVNWYDFHVQAFLPTLFFFALHYLSKEKWTRYFIFTILALTVQESVPIIVVFMGFYVAWRYRKPLFLMFRHKTLEDKRTLIPILTILISASWFLLTRWIHDTFFLINPDFLSDFRGAPNFTILGVEDPVYLPLYVLLRPWKAIEALKYNAHLKLLYLIFLFGPLALLPLKSELLFATLPWFGFSLLSQTSYHYSIINHYGAYVIPFIFVAAIYGLRKKLTHSMNPSDSGVRRSWMKKMLVFSVIFFFISSPLGLLVNIFYPSYGLPRVTEHEMLLNEVIELIPPNASVLTQNNIFPHVSNRLHAYVVPHQDIWSLKSKELSKYLREIVEEVDFILLDVKSDVYASNLLFSFIDDEFSLFIHVDGIYLYKRLQGGTA